MARHTNVTLASNGKYWQAKYQDSHGQKRKKSLGPKSKLSRRAAKKLCNRLAAELEMNPLKADAGRAPSLGAWFDLFIAQKAGMSEGTLKTYRLAYQRLAEFLGDSIRIDQITPTHAANWKASMATSHLATASVATYVSHVKTIFKAAADQGILIKSPFNNIRVGLKRFNREWHYVDAKTFQRVLEACPNPGWRCFLALQRYGGLRRGEAMVVRWGMVDLDSKQIHLPAENASGEKVTKTRQPRMVPMTPVLFDELRNARLDDPEPSDLVVTGVNSSSISNQHSRLRNILKRAKVEPWEDLMQTLRRCAAQDLRALLKDSWAVTQIMGHSEDVERDYYLSHLRKEDIDLVTESKPNADLDLVIAGWDDLSDTDQKTVLELISKSKRT